MFHYKCSYKGSGAKRIGKNGGDRYQTKQQGGLVCERASYRGRAEVIAFKWWVEKCGGGEMFTRLKNAENGWLERCLVK